jgi:hypothetical protein
LQIREFHLRRECGGTEIQDSLAVTCVVLSASVAERPIV